MCFELDPRGSRPASTVIVSREVASLVSDLDAAFAMIDRAAATEACDCPSLRSQSVRRAFARLIAALSASPRDIPAVLAFQYRLIDIVGPDQDDLRLFNQALIRSLNIHFQEQEPELALM